MNHFRTTVAAITIASAAFFSCSSDSSNASQNEGDNNLPGNNQNFTAQTTPAEIQINGGAPIGLTVGWAELSNATDDEYTIELHPNAPSFGDPWEFLAYGVNDTNWTLSIDVPKTPGVYPVYSSDFMNENVADTYAKKYLSPEANSSGFLQYSFKQGSIRTSLKGTDSLLVELNSTGVALIYSATVFGEEDPTQTSKIQGFITIPIVIEP